MKKIVLAILGFCMTALLSAEPVTTNKLPYFCGFESEAENVQWILNPDIKTVNMWTTGTAESYVGKKSLYISNDSGVSANYTNTPNIVLAYREFTLTAGTYDLAFDWKAMGVSNKAYMRVLFTTRSNTYLKGQASHEEPTWWTQYIQAFAGDSML